MPKFEFEDEDAKDKVEIRLPRMKWKQFIIIVIINIVILYPFVRWQTSTPRTVNYCGDTKAASQQLYQASQEACNGQWDGWINFNPNGSPSPECGNGDSGH